MKKLALSLLALTALAGPSAQAASVGGFIGTDAGIHYQYDAPIGTTRYGITALGLFSRQVAAAGEVAVLRDFAPATPSTLTPYYGFGLGAGVTLGASANAVGIYPHGLLGLRYNTTSPLSFFGEVNAGPRLVLGNPTQFELAGGARLGVNYTLR